MAPANASDASGISDVADLDDPAVDHRAAGMTPIDINTGEPMDLDVAVVSDVATGIWD